MPRRGPGVTIRHVAADAGVSLQTVSRVINKAPNVRPETAVRVQASIDKLGYVPLIAAQRMGGARSRLILALNDRDRTIADWRSRQGTDWVDQMLLGGLLTCAEHGYRMIIELIDTHSDHIGRELSAALGALQPDGVILTPPHSQDAAILNMLAEQGIAIARIGSLTPGPGFSITMDDANAAVLATEHLLELGHERIGFIAGPDDYELSELRTNGWEHAMATAGAQADLLEQGDFSYASGRSAAEKLLQRDRPPTAIIACNDQMALATLDLARERDLSIPHSLSLISFDDTPVARFVHPSLTAIVQPIAAVTARAVELIIAEQNGQSTACDVISVPATLIIRDSTAPPPALP